MLDAWDLRALLKTEWKVKQRHKWARVYKQTSKKGNKDKKNKERKKWYERKTNKNKRYIKT